jgi:DNA polymerase-1
MSKVLALDIETTGLNFMRKSIVSIQIGDGATYKFHDMRHNGNSIIKKYAKELSDPTIIKIMHNAAFDASFIEREYGIKIRNIYDTRLMETIILGIGTIPNHLKSNEETKKKFSTSLKYTLARYKLAKLEKETAKSFLSIGDAEFTKKQIEYAMNDIRYLHKLRELQLGKIKKLGLEYLADIENRCAEATVEMRINGINFDKAHWLKLAKMNELKVDKIISKLNKLSNNAVSNWNSPVQVKRYLNSIGIPITSLSDLHTGQHQRKDFLKGQSEVLDVFIELTESSKYVSTYGVNWLSVDWSKDEKNEPTLGKDGRVHCDFNQIIDTGRFSCSKPNLQQLPSNKYVTEYQSHRKSFIPSKGYKFVIGDFSGQELGIMAAGSNETKWIDMIERGEDVHSSMAQFMFPEKWKAGTDKGCAFESKMQKCECKQHKFLRQFSKTLTFGLPYGKGPQSIAEDLGISVFEARKQVNTFKAGVPNLTKWLNTNAQYAIDNYKIRTLPPFNRYRNLVLEDETWRRHNKGLNTPVQGSGGDMLKLALISTNEFIRESGVPAKLLVCVHDEIVTEAHTGYAKEWNKELQRIMEESAMVITKKRLVTTKPVIADWWYDKSV